MMHRPFQSIWFSSEAIPMAAATVFTCCLYLYILSICYIIRASLSSPGIQLYSHNVGLGGITVTTSMLYPTPTTTTGQGIRAEGRLGIDQELYVKLRIDSAGDFPLALLADQYLARQEHRFCLHITVASREGQNQRHITGRNSLGLHVTRLNTFE